MAFSSKIVFFGTPEFAVPTLKEILASGREVPLVVTQPDRPAGRGRRMKVPPVKAYALEQGLTILQPEKVKKPDFIASLKGVEADLFVVVAYGRILPREIWTFPRLILNVHASLLPRWRGAAPIARSILAGDATSGVSIMKIVSELDAGDVAMTRSTPIGADENAGQLSTRLAQMGSEVLVEALDLHDRGTLRFVAQDPTQVTYAPSIEVEEARVEWDQTTAQVHNQVRGFNPCPGAYTFDDVQRVKIWKSARSDLPPEKVPSGTLRREKNRLWVATGDGWLEILEIQREGRARQAVAVFLPGYHRGEPHRWE